jgi:hypothetical protein
LVKTRHDLLDKPEDRIGVWSLVAMERSDEEKIPAIREISFGGLRLECMPNHVHVGMASCFEHTRILHANRDHRIRCAREIDLVVQFCLSLSSSVIGVPATANLMASRSLNNASASYTIATPQYRPECFSKWFRKTSILWGRHTTTTS